MIYEKEFLRRLAKNGNPRWTKEGWEKIGWEDGESKWSLTEAKEIYDIFIKTLKEFLADGETVVFRGFGKFEIREIKSRTSVDLNNKEIFIPPRRRVHFTQGRDLKHLVSGESEDGGDE